MNLFILAASKKAEEEGKKAAAALGMQSICDNIPPEITAITGTAYNAIKIGVPLILVFFGMLDFGKAVMAGKEEEIKGHQKLFVKRLISALVVFLIFAIVQFLVTIVAGGDETTITDCIKTIIGA